MESVRQEQLADGMWQLSYDGMVVAVIPKKAYTESRKAGRLKLLLPEVLKGQMTVLADTTVANADVNKITEGKNDNNCQKQRSVKGVKSVQRTQEGIDHCPGSSVSLTRPVISTSLISANDSCLASIIGDAPVTGTGSDDVVTSKQTRRLRSNTQTRRRPPRKYKPIDPERNQLRSEMIMLIRTCKRKKHLSQEERQKLENPLPEIVYEKRYNALKEDPAVLKEQREMEKLRKIIMGQFRSRESWHRTRLQDEVLLNKYLLEERIGSLRKTNTDVDKLRKLRINLLMKKRGLRDVSSIPKPNYNMVNYRSLLPFHVTKKLQNA